jgi:hypothetical protein
VEQPLRSLPVIRAMTQGQPVSVTADQTDAVDALFARYAELSSDTELRRFVTRLRRDLCEPTCATNSA